MKIRKISIFLATFLGAIVALSSCTKNDGPITNRVTINDIPAIQTKIEASGSQAIDLLNLASFNGKFTVSLYFADATGPSKVDVVVRKNGSAANVKVFKTGVTTLPATFSITSAEIASLFGAPIALGDTYDFAPNIYIGDRMFEAFPAVGNGTGAGVIAMPGFSEFSRFAAICAYDPAIYQGNFVVVSDAFGDFSPGEVVALTKIDNTSFSFIDPYATNPVPIIVKINTLNNQASVAKQKIGDRFVWNPTSQPGAFITVTASTASFVAPCSKTVTLAAVYGVDAGTYSGTYPLVLRKP